MCESGRANEDDSCVRSRPPRPSHTQVGKLCATPFGVDIVGITEFVALVGALVGGVTARQRKEELERLNEQLRKINLGLRQQARAGTVYAPGGWCGTSSAGTVSRMLRYTCALCPCVKRRVVVRARRPRRSGRRGRALAGAGAALAAPRPPARVAARRRRGQAAAAACDSGGGGGGGSAGGGAQHEHPEHGGGGDDGGAAAVPRRAAAGESVDGSWSPSVWSSQGWSGPA